MIEYIEWRAYYEEKDGEVAEVKELWAFDGSVWFKVPTVHNWKG